jgi:hypothetical protein
MEVENFPGSLTQVCQEGKDNRVHSQINSPEQVTYNRSVYIPTYKAPNEITWK